MLIFRYKRNILIIQFILFLFILFIMGAGGYLGIELSRVFNAPISTIIILGASFFILLFAFLFVWLGINLYSTWNTRLVLDTNSVQVMSLKKYQKFLPWTGRSFLVEKDDISVVRAKDTGMLEIIDANGRSYIVALGAFENDAMEQVTKWLTAHLPSEKIELDLNRKITQKVNPVKLIPVYILLLVVLFITFMNIDFFRSRLTNAWTKEYSFRMFEYTRQVRADSRQDGLWVLVNGKKDEYSVHHFWKYETQEWKLPESRDLGNTPEMIGNDENGLPIAWFERGVLRYAGEWKSNRYASNLGIPAFALDHGVVSGDRAWVIIETEVKGNLIELDASGAWTLIPIPASAEQKNYSPQLIWQAVNRDLIVLMSNDTSSVFYVLSKQRWMSQVYPITIPQYSAITDCFMDSKGYLWVLISSILHDEFSVKRIAPDGEAKTTQLPLPASEEGRDYYDSLLVDSHGRLWIPGGYPVFIDVFSPVWDGSAEKLVRYTDKNSNFNLGISADPVMSSDGYIWSVYDSIVSIDSNVDDLPNPFPDWFVWATNTQTLSFVNLIMILFVVISLLQSRLLKRKDLSTVK